MKFVNRNALSGILICGAICFCITAKAMRMPRVELLREVNVAGARVSLADLLPSGAENSLREQAEEISLGVAPQPGHTRVLERDGILAELRASESIAARVAVPEQVVVAREGRDLGVEEVFGAIRNALAQISSSAAEKLTPPNVLFQTQILVKPGDAGLQVLHFDFDPGMKRGRFLLWPSRDPNVLPFYVAVRFAEDFVPIALPEAKMPSHLVDRSGLFLAVKQNAKTEILVSPFEKATLVLRSGALNMIADVLPLERGSMGQRIRVRVLDTGKIFAAQVDGPAHLELKF